MAHRIVRISVEEMQERFEEEGLRYPEDIGVSVIPMTPTPIGESLRNFFPDGTMTVMLVYVNNETGEEVARAHTFQDREGNILASGTPDPKRLVVGDTIYIVERQPLRPLDS